MVFERSPASRATLTNCTPKPAPFTSWSNEKTDAVAQSDRTKLRLESGIMWRASAQAGCSDGHCTLRLDCSRADVHKGRRADPLRILCALPSARRGRAIQFTDLQRRACACETDCRRHQEPVYAPMETRAGPGQLRRR